MLPVYECCFCEHHVIVFMCMHDQSHSCHLCEAAVSILESLQKVCNLVSKGLVCYLKKSRCLQDNLMPEGAQGCPSLNSGILHLASVTGAAALDSGRRLDAPALGRAGPLAS